MEHPDLLALLEQTDLTSLEHVRYVPTSFDPKDPNITAFPFSDGPWFSAEQAFETFDSQIAMARLPFFWQLHARLHAACRKTSAVMYANAQNNSPLALAAIRSLPIDTIVTDAKSAESFAHEMYDDGLRETMSWLIIQSPTDKWDLPDILKNNHRIAKEMHLFPGLVLLWQCKEQIASTSGAFHSGEDFVLEVGQSDTFVSTDGPVRLDKYRLPFPLHECGSCPCGKPLYARAA